MAPIHSFRPAEGMVEWNLDWGSRSREEVGGEARGRITETDVAV